MKTIELLLTDFVDIVHASGTPKATKVRQAKEHSSETYDPAKDFYKAFREGLASTHRKGGDKATLQQIRKQVKDPKKVTAYGELVTGYGKWWGRKKLSWIKPPRGDYEAHGVSVTVNPELHLDVDGQPHVLKLYLKEGKLTKNRVDLILNLMASTLSPNVSALGVLDVRRSKLFLLTKPTPGADAMVDAELAYVAALWPRL